MFTVNPSNIFILQIWQILSKKYSGLCMVFNFSFQDFILFLLRPFTFPLRMIHERVRFQIIQYLLWMRCVTKIWNCMVPVVCVCICVTFSLITFNLYKYTTYTSIKDRPVIEFSYPSFLSPTRRYIAFKF